MYKHALVWHCVTATSQLAWAQSLQSQKKASFNFSAGPVVRVCVGYNQSTCTDHISHPKELHACSYYMAKVRRVCAHPEHFWRMKVEDLARNSEGEG